MIVCRGRSSLLAQLVAVGLICSPSLSRAETVDQTEVFEGTRSLVGSYLAGRLARTQNDADEAAEFYRNALLHDPSNELLLEQAFQIEAARGDWPRAFKLAEDLVGLQKQHRMAQLALALRDFKSGDWRQSEEHFKEAGSGPIGELTSAMAIAWVHVSHNELSQALTSLDLPKQAEWAQFFLRYHRALIADIADKRKDARQAYEKVYGQDGRTLRTALAFARHAAITGDRKKALSIIDAHIAKSQGDGHPLLRSLRATLVANRSVAPIVTNASEGMAEVFYGLGEALIGEGAVAVGVLYMQMALYIEPTHQFALAALASAYEGNKQYTDAIKTYDRIPATSPLTTAVEIRKAFNLNSLDKLDEARATLTRLLDDQVPAAAEPVAKSEPVAAPVPAAVSRLAELADDDDVLRLGDRGDGVKMLQEALNAIGQDVGTPDGRYGPGTRRAVAAFQASHDLGSDGVAGPATLRAIAANGAPAEAAVTTGAEVESRLPLTISDRLEILDAIGNILRAHKLYAEAIPYYDKALGLIPKPERRHWAYYYARGTSYERMKNWPAAEADLQKALALYPDQPLILNYLGYSWIDQGRNLKEGMALIEKAVALKPEDGYIVDSLGWAHFMQGNFEDAVRYLERAVELEPNDPVLNDHLGDALWRVGREREARYQWDQALTLKPTAEDEAKIKKKLESGLAAAQTPPEASKQASSTSTEADQK
jgi:tetratricopeptide (TPR) repeat protein